VSALHRMGVVSAVVGSALSALGVDGGLVERSLARRLPAIEEVERYGDVIVLMRCIPFVAAGEVTGALLLLRDVTDLRRRDRLLLSKDAAIREVHHRVKNNLQTISSLLRLQARRLEEGSQREALVEAERRVRSIALVHELLSRDSGDQVPFDEIVHSLVRMAKDSNVSGRPLALRVDGDAGKVPSEIATPLAVVLAELLQNAVEHGFVAGSGPPGATPAQRAGKDLPPDGAGPALVELVFRHDEEGLQLEVRDNGRGLPEDFDMDASAHLGLAIVRDLVRTQLEGTIGFSTERGTVVRLAIPLRQRVPRRG
jgi:two-component system, sensor histidine kinase PdtaS